MDVKSKADALQQIKQIRSIIDKSSRFISLSGLSGVYAGSVALLGGFAGKWLMTYHLGSDYKQSLDFMPSIIENNALAQIIGLMAVIFILAISGGIFFTTRKARKQNLPVWDKMTYRLLGNLAIPILAGGLFCAALVFKFHIFGLVAPLGLIFYGLGLINGGKYTLDEIKYLGLCEIALGIIGLWFIGYGIELWMLGFGVLHIFYGLIMWYKYERA